MRCSDSISKKKQQLMQWTVFTGRDKMTMIMLDKHICLFCAADGLLHKHKRATKKSNRRKLLRRKTAPNRKIMIRAGERNANAFSHPHDGARHRKKEWLVLLIFLPLVNKNYCDMLRCCWVYSFLLFLHQTNALDNDNRFLGLCILRAQKA